MEIFEDFKAQVKGIRKKVEDYNSSIQIWVTSLVLRSQGSAAGLQGGVYTFQSYISTIQTGTPRSKRVKKVAFQS